MQAFSNFFRFPMLFLCGLFIPLAQIPSFLRPISYILPLTYGTDILNKAISGVGSIDTRVSLFVSIAFTFFLFFLCRRNIQRKWIL